MGKTVRLVPVFRCKACGASYHPHQLGILAVDSERLTEQEEVKEVLQAFEIHDCDIGKVGIAVCVGFNKAEGLKEVAQDGGQYADAGGLQYGA